MLFGHRVFSGGLTILARERLFAVSAGNSNIRADVRDGQCDATGTSAVAGVQFPGHPVHATRQ
jgi:hypothetical protein